MNALLRFLRGPFLRELEPVFRALVEWPVGAPSGEFLHGYRVRTADERREVLRLVSDALESSKRKLPAETAQRIREVVPSFDGMTYSAGARAVLANPTFFNCLDAEPKP